MQYTFDLKIDHLLAWNIAHQESHEDTLEFISMLDDYVCELEFSRELFKKILRNMKGDATENEIKRWVDEVLDEE